MPNIYMSSKSQTMCPLSSYQSTNGLVVTHVLVHMIYFYTLLVSKSQKVLIKSSKEHNTIG